jgi:hypothetical protein
MSIQCFLFKEYSFIGIFAARMKPEEVLFVLLTNTSNYRSNCLSVYFLDMFLYKRDLEVPIFKELVLYLAFQ